MTLLKDVLETVHALSAYYKKGIGHIPNAVLKREEELRTRIAKELAKVYLNYDPADEQILMRVKNLSPETILPFEAEIFYAKYLEHLRKNFGLIVGHLNNFKDIRDTYAGIQTCRGNLGAVRSWNVEELTRFRDLCTRIANDNDMEPSEVMENFLRLPNTIKVNEASLHLAKTLFACMKPRP